MVSSIVKANELLDEKDLHIEALTKKLQSAQQNISMLQHQVEQLLRRIYGRSSERMDPNQLMFDNLMINALEQPVGAPQVPVDLILVATGPLSQLPFSVLVTRPAKQEKDRSLLFDRYRGIQWLIRKASIIRLPTVSSLVLLRDQPRERTLRKAFAGFGDPVFNVAQAEKAPKDENKPSKRDLRVRGIRITNVGDMDDEKVSSIRLEDLSRLPDTAEEIREIGQILGADASRDIFLGKLASEKTVKNTDLSDRCVIAFASHALVPGDLDGLTQPAIALSSPTLTGDDEDGLLTMEEVLGLKLNADWVILSACNTAAAGGEGAEALSGLGRAFMYAGSRALLVSMWPVETTSARLLTIGLFRSQQEAKSLGYAGALQKSILDLIDHQELKNQETGKIVASYAHPFFWAPFIVVGETGGRN